MPTLLPADPPSLQTPKPPPRLVAPAGFDPKRAARVATREVDATVVVEDDLPSIPALPPSLRFGLFRFRWGVDALPPTPFGLPTWMDPAVTRSGGNVVNRVYTVGGVGF